MIETEQVDSRSHLLDFEGAMRGMLGFDSAIGTVLEFARGDGRTLVVVTSDHETGGPSVERSRDGVALDVEWATNGHTAVPVPIHAYGPGAELFSGKLDNTDIGRRLRRLLKHSDRGEAGGAGILSAAP